MVCPPRDALWPQRTCRTTGRYTEGFLHAASGVTFMFDLNAIQPVLQEFKLDAWLLYDFRGSNVLARRVLGFPEGASGSRRWFYCIPASGQPRKLVHRI